MALIKKDLGKAPREVGEITERQQFSHFSHRHPLKLSMLHDEDKADCSCCELDISGLAYVCTKPKCSFILHDLCFELPRHVHHQSHPKHTLDLSFSPPYSDGQFMCDACGDSGHTFTYHCLACKFDLHVECASLPEFEKRNDHQHPLVLLYDFEEKVEEGNFVCYVCNFPMVKGGWIYYCSVCDCGTHLGCASNEH